RYLMTLLERDGCGSEEGELVHSAAPSIFTEACNNETYVEIWNDFMNRSGEEQERVLLYLEEKAGKTTRAVRGSRLIPGHWGTPAQGHVALCAPHLGSMEGTRAVQDAGLGCAGSNPVPISPSFERLLLHALCQYMDLVSASSDIEGKRQMKVSNKHRVFLPPELLLSDYLGQMS
ncbi:R3H domain-containing protein 4, partial [Nestor notabilis]